MGFLITESQNGVGRDLRRLESNSPAETGTLQYVAEVDIQTGFVYFYSRWLHNFSGQCVPAPSAFLWSCFSTCLYGGTDAQLLVHYFLSCHYTPPRGINICQIPSQSSFPQAEQTQVTFLIWEILQALYHFCCPLLQSPVFFELGSPELGINVASPWQIKRGRITSLHLLATLFNGPFIPQVGECLWMVKFVLLSFAI